MLPQNVLLALLAAMSATAVPLNINLGAYSPALVVGDGEISFGGAQNAGELIETLATGAAANAAQAQQPAEQQQGGGEGEARKMKIKRDIAGFREALQFAREAQKDTPKLEIGSEEAGIGIIQNAGTNVQSNSAANGARPAGEKRSEQQEAQSEKQGITLLAIAEI